MMAITWAAAEMTITWGVVAITWAAAVMAITWAAWR